MPREIVRTGQKREGLWERVVYIRDGGSVPGELGLVAGPHPVRVGFDSHSELGQSRTGPPGLRNPGTQDTSEWVKGTC